MYQLDIKETILVLRALYWYQDRITNQERAKGRDDAEWDEVIWLRQQLGNKLKQEAKIV
jgi:hypothetical protein